MKKNITVNWIFTLVVFLLWACGPSSAGNIVVWGDYGLGLMDVPSGDNYIEIADMNEGCLALKSDGSVVGWGYISCGPCEVPPEASNGVVAIASGRLHALALKADGYIIAWGSNSSGQCDVPPEAGSDVIAIAGGGHHSLALKEDGSVVAWGYNSKGQCDVPPEAGSDVTAIAGGYLHSLALKSDGSIVGWGWDYYGQATPPEGDDFIAISAGTFYSLALKSDGSIIGWGWDYFGQATPPEGDDFIAIDAGSYHSLAIKTDSSIIGWGRNLSGECDVPEGSGFTAITAAVGGGWSGAIFQAGTMVIEVAIDIKPCCEDNTIPLGSYGLIPVAIFSSKEFNARMVNPGTVELGGSGVAVRGKANEYMAQEKDIDEDGLVDLLVQVATVNLDPDSLQEGLATLTGITYGGWEVWGSDVVRIVPEE